MIKDLWSGMITKIKVISCRVWAHMYSLFQMNFNPDWRKPLPPIPCQFCGKPGHLERYCPNAKGMGILD
ncbi:MAG: hypothetical protein HN686_09080 [Bacteroidetes bacterium]|jgi:hypothetical protein|nr:hypothetical protein [Bacteroidota bacterium]